jgi:hypothetical protein
MFKEYKLVRQDMEKNGYRRWFEADDQELIVWYTRTRAIKGFQLLYNERVRKYAFTWLANGYYSHTEIDEGDDLPSPNRSPVLISDGVLPRERVLAQFRKNCKGLEPELVHLVTAALTKKDEKK